MTNYYDILGILPEASGDEIKAAYTFQIKAIHPDKYNSESQPAQYARALKLTERLNEARDTLLDPTRRATYDAQLHLAREPAATPPARPAPTQKPAASRPPHPALAAAGLAVLIALATTATLRPQLSRVLAASQATTSPSPTPIPCPSGEPIVTVTGTQILSQPTSFGAISSKLYVVTGTLDNPTSATIHADELGFYLGEFNRELRPVWSDSLAAIATSGDFTTIPPHSSVTWKSKHIVDQAPGSPAPFSKSVTATLTFPYSETTNPVPQWYWTDSGPGCPNN